MEIDRSSVKKKPAQPRFSNLASVRRELGRLYGELRATGPGSETYFRACGYLLQLTAEILKTEKTDELEQRIVALEKTMKEKP